MTILTCERPAIGPVLMFDQTVAGLLVRKGADGRRSLIGRAAVMFLMA